MSSRTNLHWILLFAFLFNLFLAPAGETQTRVSNRQVEDINLAGLSVAVWYPRNWSAPVPLVVFSHGFHGTNRQSGFIMQAMADDGYLVVAPNHADAMGAGKTIAKPQTSFRDPASWTEKSYRDRGEDIAKLLQALYANKNWSSRIDWNNIVLCGHSLGGYTVLALAGAWSTWKIPNLHLKAVLALSPYCQPFVVHKTLANVSVPLMYQGGTRDFGVTPFISKLGAFDLSPSPTYFVDLDNAGHFAWTNLNRNAVQENLINYYCLGFLDRYVKGSTNANLRKPLPGVFQLLYK